MSKALDEFLRRREATVSTAGRMAVRATSDVAPERAAQAAQVSRQAGVPAAVALIDPTPFQQNVEAEVADYQMRRAPRLSQWLAQRETNAPMARDDLDVLSETERTVTEIAPQKGFWERAGDWFEGFRSDLTMENVGKALGAGAIGIAESIAGGVAEGYRVSKESEDDFLFGGINRARNRVADFAENKGRQWGEVGQFLRPETQTEEGEAVLAGIESSVLSVGALAVGWYTRSAKAAALLAGAATGGRSYLDAIEQGLGINEARRFAATDAAIEAGTELLPFSQLLKADNGGFMQRLVRSTAGEVIGEQFATLGQDFNRFASIEQNQGKTFEDFLAERPSAAYQTLIASVVTSGTMNATVGALDAVVGRYARRQISAQNAANQERFMTALGKLSEASKVRGRDVETFEDFVREVADGTGAADVYIGAEDLATVFDQSGVTPEQAYEITGMSPEEIQDAVDRGDDLRIGIETFAARAGDLTDSLVPHLRLNPDDMSKAQADVFMQSAAEEFAADSQTAIENAGTESASSRDRVRDQIFDELTNAGRFTADVNLAYASLVADFYATMGGRFGETAEQMADRYKLKVQAGETAQPTYDQATDPFDDVERLLDRDDWAVMTAENPNAEQLSEEENAARNEELRADLRAMGVAFREVKGKYGNEENSLAISGITREQAMALGEKYGQESVLTRDGLVYGDGTVNPATGVERVGEEQEDFFSTLDDGTRFAVGIDFDQRVSVNSIVIDGVRRSTVNSEGQPLAQTEEGVRNFWAWFGDSKVVDAEGRPLVVYHGTESEFDAFDPAARGRNFATDKAGFFFTTDSDDAMQWAAGTPGDYPESTEGLRVVEAYLKIEDPLEIDAGPDANEEIWYINRSAYAAQIGERGKDGAIVSNDDGDQMLVANEPTQIKSINNTGQFDPADPRILYQSAAELQALPLGIEGTGPGGRVLNKDLGEAFTLRHMMKYGRALDPANEEDYALALEALVEDYQEQAQQEDNGEAWYSDDIAEAIEVTTQLIPELADPVNRDLFLTVAALLSPQQKPKQNWENAIYAMRGYLSGGTLALRKPNGKQFGVNSHTTGLQLLQYLIDTKGVEEALLWVRTPQTGKAMAEVRRDSGLFAEKARLGMYTPNEVTLKDELPGIYTFGPKVGDFAQNSVGIDDQAVTIDLWAARTYNRIVGRLTDVTAKLASEGKIAEQVRGRSERDMIKSLFRDAAEQAGIAPSAMQAALWYFEQRLYRNHGIRSDSQNFSGAARAAAAKLSNGLLPQGDTGSSRRTAARNAEEGVRVFNQDAPNPLDLFKRQSLYPSRAVRHEDGKVYADVPDWYPDRLAAVAEQLGVDEVVGLGDDAANDPRLDEGVPLWYSRPPVNADGTITLQHWTLATDPITKTDPTRWGQSKTLPNSERNAINSSPPRTYFGIASGKPGGYVIEFPSRAQVEARIPAEELYDIMADPDGLKPAGTDAKLEWKVKEAGYKGYWRAHDALGMVAVVFEPLDVQPVTEPIQGEPLFQGKEAGTPRGQIAFGKDITQTDTVITLLRGADLSTFLHETGHFFLEAMTDAASRADAPPGVMNDMRLVLDYFGIKSLEDWRGMPTSARRTHHEKFARSFERYLFEGKAPSVELQGLFGRFRSWLKDVYRTLAALKAPLTDEVRGVFDRMLASEQQIADAQADAEMEQFFKSKPDEMSEADWTAYQQTNEEATEEAERYLESRSMRDMRFSGKAVAREIKRLQREVAEKRKGVQEEVEADLAQQPVYRAIIYLRKGEINGEVIEGDHRLLTPDIKAILDVERLPPGLSGMTSTENGVPVQVVAELFGYTSADHLLQDLQFASPFRDAVEAETDNRMRERYGEVSSPEAIEQAAHAAVHNEVRGRHVATELAVLRKAPGKRKQLNDTAKRMARELVARIKIRNLRPSQFENAERKAARAAIKAGAENLEEATRQKRNQLLQFHSAKEAHAAAEEVSKAREYLRKFQNEGTRKAIDQSYLDQIDQILERYDLRTGISNAEADRRKTLKEWIEQQQAAGFEPMLDPDMLDTIGRKPWRELTVEEMRGLLDGIKNIEHIGRTAKKLLTAIDKAELNDAADEVAGSIQDNAAKVVPEIVGSKTWWERVKQGFDDFFAMHRKFANFAYLMDGNRYGGPMWERFIRPMNAAGDAETTMNAEAAEALGEIFKRLPGNTHKRQYIPELNLSLSLEDRLMFALNWGNSTNRARIMDGDKLTEDQVGIILGTLTAENWDFVESVWEYIDSWWPRIAAKEERISGVAPEKVEAEPFQLEIDGELRLLRGGYFPIKYDPDRSSKAEADTAAEVQTQMQRGLYTRATTRRGHTKQRVDTVNRAVRKDFGVVFEHMSTVVHDLAWHEYLIDANRLLRHGAVDSAIRTHYGPAALKWIRKALEDIAIGDIPAMNAMERSVNHIRAGASIAGLGWNLWTSLLQPIGLTQSWARIGGRHVLKGIGGMFGSPKAMNDKIKWMYEVSPFMRARGDTMQREINEIRNRISPKSPIRKTVGKVVPDPVADAITDSFFVLIAKAQLMADMPTWLGQYHKSLEAGESPDRAVALADQAVIDSQGGGQIKDLSGVQRGSPIWKLWTNFYSYFNVTYNLMSDRTGEMRRKGWKDLPYYAVDISLLTVLPATLTGIMRVVLKGGEDEDEPDEIAALLAKENASYMMGLMIGMREVSGALSGNAGMSYSGPAGARALAELNRFGKQAAQGELDEAFFRSANAVGGVLLHYPSGQVDRTARGVMSMVDGDAGPMAPIVGPPPE